MPRLIDADKLREHKYKSVQYERTIANELSNDPTYAFMCGWNDAIDSIVENAPTVDAVRHGHWIKANDPMSSPFDTMKRCLCSECREWGAVTSYCPHCGAKMDEVAEDATETA